MAKKTKPPASSRFKGDLEAQIKHIQETRYDGDVAGAMPYPWEDGFMVHRVLLRGVPVRLKFDQQPPKGAFQITQVDKVWSGSLLFMTPKGEMWVVPNVWYNRTWAQRLEELRDLCDRNAKHIAVLRKQEAYWETFQSNTAAQELRDIRHEIRSKENSIRGCEALSAHILKHADLDECPGECKIPELRDFQEEDRRTPKS